MVKRLLLHVTRVISAGWCAEWLLGGACDSNFPCLEQKNLMEEEQSYTVALEPMEFSVFGTKFLNERAVCAGA
jgi:hypothetical protein